MAVHQLVTVGKRGIVVTLAKTVVGDCCKTLTVLSKIWTRPGTSRQLLSSDKGWWVNKVVKQESVCY